MFSVQHRISPYFYLNEERMCWNFEEVSKMWENHLFQMQISLWNVGLTCSEFQTYKAELINNLWESKWKKYIRCRVWIEKIQVCNNLTYMFWNEFCFICAKIWKTYKCKVSACSSRIIEVEVRIENRIDDELPVWNSKKRRKTKSSKFGTRGHYPVTNRRRAEKGEEPQGEWNQHRTQLKQYISLLENWKTLIKVFKNRHNQSLKITIKYRCVYPHFVLLRSL